MIERTLVLVKPDGVQRGLIGEVVKRFEQRGLKIIAMKMVKGTDELLRQHYDVDVAERHGEEARQNLIKYLQETPVVAMVLEGVHVIDVVRKLAGSTFPGDALPGTIRGDFVHASKDFVRATNKGYNVVHSSGNAQEAQKEIGLWFSQEEIYDYKTNSQEHVM